MIFVGYYLSSRPVVFCNKGVLRIFSKFTGKHQCWSVFLIKLQACSSFKMRLQHRCFPENFARFFRTPILYMITYAIQNSCTKTFTAKSMWTTASGISENRPCLASCKFIDVLQNFLSVSCADEHTTNVLTLMTQHK